jgi:hypothetical protein
MIIDKKNSEDINKEFKKQMIWFHTNYMKTERENQLLWINNQISHLNNLKRFVFNSNNKFFLIFLMFHVFIHFL